MSAARDLIVSLDNERRYSERLNLDVPIAFLAHGTGGLIVKQVLILLNSYQEKSDTRILSNTRSLLFFGVPHRGYANSVLDYMPWIWSLKGIEEEYTPQSKEVRAMLEGFASISNRFRIYTFINTIKTSTWPASSLQLGDYRTYYMGLPNEELIYSNTEYFAMLKLAHNSAEYNKVVSILRRIPRASDLGSESAWHFGQQFRLDEQESEFGKLWFRDLRSDAHRVVNRRPMDRSSKIAILDSGIDLDHSSFQEAVDEDHIVVKSFVEGLPGDQDSDGHGTHTAHLTLKVAPNSTLFIARVIEHGSIVEFDNNKSAIVKAIKWAIEERVDIISMSFGYRAEVPEIKAALRKAFHKGIILIAAASNSGVNPRFPISFPANMRQVICMHSTDGYGNPSPRNPSAIPDCNLGILGEAVAAAWPRQLDIAREASMTAAGDTPGAAARPRGSRTMQKDHSRVASGTSVAAPIAAGIAALILEYASQASAQKHDSVVQRWGELRHCDEMRKLFRSIAKERGGYQSITPSSLFDYHGEGMHRRVCGRIGDVLDSL
ncbi:hypothetical protein ACLOAV_008635 [Pseudogymnoascus australis]